MFSTTCLKISRTIFIRHYSSEQCYAQSNVRNIMKKRKLLHPYRKIHPWKSVEQFSNSLAADVIHNEDGLVVINKPYGISGNGPKITKPAADILYPTGIVGQVNYTLSDALPLIAEKLGYSELKVVSTPERFTSGIAILSANDGVTRAVNKSLERAQGMKIVSKMYWAITTRVPNELKGEKRLAMKMKQCPTGKSQLPIIINSWSENERSRRDIKILNVQFKVISNSVDNLSSLIAMRSSTKKWHALRLFAATVLFSPILGDNIYGSRVQNVLGKWMNISPFVEAAQVPPRLNKDLLDILKINNGNESMIPAHLHLREVYLPGYRRKDRNLILTASPMPEFIWTGQQLKFKHELFATENATDEEDCPDPERNYAVI